MAALMLLVGVDLLCSLAPTSASAFPVPAALPPHGWGTVGDKLFIHGCKADGLFNASELALAARFGLLTVEKGQGLALPGFADAKMAAIAAQWKAARREASRPDGWALFYLNAHFDWPFFALHAQMEAHPGWPQQLRGALSGEPCLGHGDRTFPQPAEGMLLFNHSTKAVRTAFINVRIVSYSDLGSVVVLCVIRVTELCPSTLS